MPEYVPFWKTREFWLEGEPPNYRLGVTNLEERYPDSCRSTWGHRRRWAMTHFADLDWAQLVRGAFVQGDYRPTGKVFGEAPEAAPLPSPLTTEQMVKRDREVRRLTARLTEIEAKYESAMRGADVEDRICSAIDVRVNAFEPVGAPSFAPRNPGRPESVVALFSDSHIGEVVSAEETGGLNAYDFDIFSRRLQYHVDAIGGICFGKLTGYDFPELVILGLGDMVSGIIHDELVETSDGTLVDWLIDGSHLFAQAIRSLAAEFPSVRVEWHFGNHGRVTQKPRFKRRWVNYDHLMGHMIATELRDQTNVSFANHKSFWSVTDVQGHKVLSLHGDNIKSWGGLPAYGIQRAVSNLSALLGSQRKSFDTVCLGHFHQTGLLERVDCDIVLNGSYVGGNEYSYGALFTGSKPRQVMFGIHPERGRTWSYAIDLSNGDSHECRFTR